MKTKFTLLATLFILALQLNRCKDEEGAVGPDLQLFNEATATSGFAFYQDNPSILTSSNASGHRPYMRVKFNSIAQSVLGLDGRLPNGSSFPNGSLIVKELYDNPQGNIQLYAVLKKDSLDPSAGVNWLWGEYYADGSVAASVTEVGSQCISCHSTNSRDYVRVFDLF